MHKIKGKIGLVMKPAEYPKDSGKYSLGIKVAGQFYNFYDELEKLEELSKTLKVGYEVELEADNNKIKSFEIISAVEEVKDLINQNDSIIKISGKDYMTYKGLLLKAHEKDEEFSMVILDSYVSDDMTKAWCIVRLTAGNTTFDGFGSSTPENTGRMTQTHPVEMAHTRAKGRALRDYLNIGEVMAEELSK